MIAQVFVLVNRGEAEGQSRIDGMEGSERESETTRYGEAARGFSCSDELDFEADCVEVGEDTKADIAEAHPPLEVLQVN